MLLHKDLEFQTNLDSNLLLRVYRFATTSQSPNQIIIIASMQFSNSNTASKSQKQHKNKPYSDASYQSSSKQPLPSSKMLQTQTFVNYQQSFAELKTGLIEKKTMNTRWQTRFFVLTPLRLIYFADQQRDQLKGCFNWQSLKQFNLKVTLTYPEIAQFYHEHENITLTKTILLLQIYNGKEFKEWQLAFNNAFNYISTKNYINLCFPQLSVSQLMQSNQKIGKINNNFWNHLKISKAELISYVSHLDIIFLRSKSVFSNIHRFFMRSYFDHVAVILKDQSQRIYLLQAIHDKGVTISRLDNLFESFHQEYQDIGYRKLLTTQNTVLPLQKLQEYVNHLVGKKYELSISKLLIDNETDYADSGDESSQETSTNRNQKTYFCSQLIADIYLKFGVLIQGKSNNYWPKDFQEGYLPLSTGFYLSPMMKVQMPVPEDIDRSILDD